MLLRQATSRSKSSVATNDCPRLGRDPPTAGRRSCPSVFAFPLPCPYPLIQAGCPPHKSLIIQQLTGLVHGSAVSACRIPSACRPGTFVPLRQGGGWD